MLTWDTPATHTACIDIFVAAYVSRNRTKGPLFNSVTGKLSQKYHAYACLGALTSQSTSEARRGGGRT